MCFHLLLWTSRTRSLSGRWGAALVQVPDLLSLLGHRQPSEETALLISDPGWTQRSCPPVLSKYLNIGFVLEMLFVGEDEYSYYVQCVVLLNVLHVTPFGPHCSPVRGRHVVLVFWFPFGETDARRSYLIGPRTETQLVSNLPSALDHLTWLTPSSTVSCNWSISTAGHCPLLKESTLCTYLSDVLQGKKTST